MDSQQLHSLRDSRELLSITALLNHARELVAEDARARSLAIVVVGVHDEVFVDRARVLLVVATLLRRAINATPPGGRVAVTAQEFERELVFAVYDSGTPRAPVGRLPDSAAEAASALGGYVWGSAGNLALFSVPLYRDAN